MRQLTCRGYTRENTGSPALEHLLKCNVCVHSFCESHHLAGELLVVLAGTCTCMHMPSYIAYVSHRDGPAGMTYCPCSRADPLLRVICVKQTVPASTVLAATDDTARTARATLERHWNGMPPPHLPPPPLPPLMGSPSLSLSSPTRAILRTACPPSPLPLGPDYFTAGFQPSPSLAGLSLRW